jgi:outer membrane protein OmpA-like peptidoglycan-associated protein
MKNNLLKVFLFILLSFSNIYSKKFYFNFENNKKIQLIIRGNYKIYLNDSYKGLQTKEIKALLNIKNLPEKKISFEGQLYLYDKSMRDKSNIGIFIDSIQDCEYSMNSEGLFDDSETYFFPILQNLPYFPDIDLKEGDVYENYGKAIINFFNSTEINVMEILIKTKYSGKKNFMGNDYDYFELTYEYIKPLDSKEIENAKGLHRLELFFDNTIKNTVFIKDHFIDEFELKNTDRIKRDGFILYFYKNIQLMDKYIVKKDLTNDIDKNILKDIDIKDKQEGISITINNLKFKADSTELLETEVSKLDEIYKMLSKIKNRSFLIVGHTAKAGTEESQLKLSIERAKTIADLLIKKGIPSSLIFYTGKGALEPIVPNDTEENMQKNRRVEIIILEGDAF